jgi:sugar transferase (PEP-CTERM system associated)
MRVFNRHVSGRGATVFGFETALIVAAIIVAAHLHGAILSGVSAVWQVLFITSICALSFYYNDLYDFTLAPSAGPLGFRVLRGAGAAAIALGLITALLPQLGIGASAMLTALGLILLIVPAWRLAFESVSSDAHLGERVLILGTGPTARLIARHIAVHRDFGYTVVGYVDDVAYDEETRVLGRADQLARIIETHRIDRIVVTLADGRGRLPIQELLQAKLAGVRVEEGATTYERMTGKVLIEQLKPSWLVFSDGFRASRMTRIVKRVLDVAFASAGLIIGAPLMLLTALMVRLDSPGGVLYRQERVGQHGRTFTLFKFRSMRSNAENGTPVWASSNDTRVTRVGRFIRLTRLDEMPQLWNVLRGDMSFVGPRPERPFFVDQLCAALPYYEQRHAVRPGVTGWAQVRYHYGASIEDAAEKLQYDLYYIKHLSIAFDLTIFLDTVKVILARKGAQ